MIWNEYSKYNTDIQKKVVIPMYGSDGVRKGNFLGEWRLM